jgi:hypothetical protein
MSEKSSTTAILKRQLQWMKAPGIQVKTANSVMVEYVAPYTPQQNGKVERQFPSDLKRANSMLDTVKLSVAHMMKL